jgi:hypothetical protein
MKYYFIYPKFNKYQNTNGFPPETIYFPLIDSSSYGENYFCNEHHFKPFYHIEYVLPILEKLYQFGYKRSDFSLHEDFDNNNDISYLKPKKEFLFDIYDISQNTYIKQVDSDFLRHNMTKDSTGDLYKITKYHQLFTFAHKSCLIMNKTIQNNRKLVISCDSQMIPILPVLCCYFNEVWILDKREEYTCEVSIDDINPTDIIIAGGFYKSNKYLKDNFTCLKQE